MNKNKCLELTRRTAYSLALPIIVYLVLAVLRPDIYLSGKTFMLQLTSSLKVVITGWAMMFGMSVGLFDFSVGSRVILAALVGIHASQYFGVPGFLIATILASVGLAALTGIAYAGLKIPSIIAGFAAMLIFESLATIYQKQFSVIVTDNIAVFGKAPVLYIVVAITFVIVYILYNNTKFGYQIKAIGGNEAVARSMGIKTVALKMKTYLVGGLFLGIAAVVEVGYTGSVTASTSMQSMSKCFTPMMGVMIGMYLSSCNPVIGSVIGAFCISIVGSGLVALGIESRLQNVVVGIFLLVFIGIKSNQDRLMKLFRRKGSAQEAES